MKVMGSPAPAATELTSVPDDIGHTSWSQRVRSLLLGPHGGGTTRRRASDAVRVGIAAGLVVVCVPLARANTSVEIHVTELITPPPSGIHWLITALWFLGSIGVIVTLVLVGLLVPRLAAVRQMAVAGVAALLECLLLDALLGSAAGRPPIPDFAGFNLRFPILQLAVATAVALAGLPYLSRPASSRRGTASTRAPLITLTAPVEVPWSCNSTFPPLGQAISQASKSGVRAISRHERLCMSSAPGQCTAGARRLATSWGFMRGPRTEAITGPAAATIGRREAGGIILPRLGAKPD